MQELAPQQQDACYIDQFPHKLPHRNAAQMRPCGHAACDPHTIAYYGSGADPEREGEYCLICFGQQFGIWPDKLVLAAFAQDMPKQPS